MKHTFCILLILFLSAFSLAKESSISIGKKLETYKVIMVKSNTFHKNPIFNTDYSDHIQYFKKHNLIENYNFEIIETEASDAPEYAARDIVKAIRDSRLKVILWAHDKSSVDVLEALLSYPLLQNKVLGFISVQGTIAGLKEAIHSRPTLSVETNQIAAEMPLFQALRYWMNFIYSFIEHESAKLYSMNPLVRDDYLRFRAKNLNRLNQRVKVVSVGEKQDPYFVIPGSQVNYIGKSQQSFTSVEEKIEDLIIQVNL